MREFQEKNKIRRIMYSKASLIALFVIIFFIGRAVLGVYHKQKISEENLLMDRKKVAELEKREKGLSFEIERLKSSDGIEEEIRKKFMVGKAGEQVIVIVDEAKSSTSVKIEERKKSGLWTRFTDLFR